MCERRTLPGEGELVRRPDFFGMVCGTCMLKCDPEPGFLQQIDAESRTKGYTLRPFQREDVLRASLYRRMLIASEMGTGKTIVASKGLLRRSCVNLVFVPASMRETWRRELKEWRPDLNPQIAKRAVDWSNMIKAAKPGTVIIAGYRSLPGEPCPGCKSRGIKACSHYGPDTPHPEWIKRGGRYEPYRLPTGKNRDELIKKILRGEKRWPPRGAKRWQSNPMPEIDQPMVLICDEAHALKSPNAQRTKRWRELARRVTKAGGYVYGLTGTPAENDPREYWNVLTSLGLERAAFGTWETFEDLFDGWLLADSKEDRKPPTGHKLAEIQVRLGRVRVRRRTEDVLPDLPPIRRQTIHVEISEKKIGEINKAVQHMFAKRRAWHDVQTGLIRDPYQSRLPDDEAVRRRMIFDQRVESYFIQKPWDYDAEVLAAVREVINPKSRTPTIGELAKVRRLLSLAKIEAVSSWVNDCEEQVEPIVLFSQHVEIVKRFGSRPGWVPFHGSMPANKRDGALNDFQEGKVPFGISVSIGAGREGITLTRSRVAGFVDLNWNPARNRQAEARVRRLGSEKHDSILLVRFVSQHPVDLRVLEVLEQKEALLDALDEGVVNPSAGDFNQWDDECD